MIAQHPIPEDTNETTQVKELLDPVDLRMRWSPGTPPTPTGPPRPTSPARGGRERQLASLPIRQGNEPSLQRAIFDAIQAPRPPRAGPHANWTTGTAGSSAAPSGSPRRRPGLPARHPGRADPRDGYDLSGTLISKEIVHAVTSLDEDRASAADLARIARGQWGIESVHWLRDTAYAEDSNTGYAGNGPRSWPRCGISPSACSTSPASPRSPAPSRPPDVTGPACSATCRYETSTTNDFADPVERPCDDKCGLLCRALGVLRRWSRGWCAWSSARAGTRDVIRNGSRMDTLNSNFAYYLAMLG